MQKPVILADQDARKNLCLPGIDFFSDGYTSMARWQPKWPTPVSCSVLRSLGEKLIG